MLTSSNDYPKQTIFTIVIKDKLRLSHHQN